MKEPFANLELNFLVHCFQHINIDRSILRFAKRISGNVFVAKKSSILMCIELHILELKKKIIVQIKRLLSRFVERKKATLNKVVIFQGIL